MYSLVGWLVVLGFNPFQNDKFLDSSKLKDFVDVNLNKNGRKFSKSWARKHDGEMEKLLVTTNFSFSHSVFKRLALQTRKNQGLFGKGLTPLKQLR